MLIVDMIAGLFLGALSGMGIGGGGLLVIYLTLLRGISQGEAQGLNLYFFVFASAAAMFVHMARRKINFMMILICIIPGMFTAWAGSVAAAAARPELLRKVFGCMLIVTGCISLFRGYLGYRNSKREKAQKIS